MIRAGSDAQLQSCCNTVSEKGVKAAPSEAAVPATAAPVKRLDNLFFIEEPTNVSVVESKPCFRFCL